MNKSILVTLSILVLLVTFSSTVHAQGLLGVQATQSDAPAAETPEDADAHAKQLLDKVAAAKGQADALKAARAECASEARALLEAVLDSKNPGDNAGIARLKTAMQLASSEGAADQDLHVEIHGHYTRIKNFEE